MVFRSLTIFIFIFLFSANSFAAESLSYSGRLVKADGSPVAGPVDLKIDLSYTDFPNTILCSQNFSTVALSNGVFHLKLDLVCPGPPVKTLTEILTSVPATFAAALRVKDVTNNKTYAFQEIHSMPFASIAETAKQLSQLGAANGDVLKWNDGVKKWLPGIPGGGGTVTSVTGTLPISVATGSSTPVISMPVANTSTSGYLSSADWNSFNTKEGTIAGGSALQYYRGDKSWQTLNTSVVPESGVTNLYFSNARALGVPLDGFVAGPGVIVATDTVLQAFAKTQGQINSLTSDSAKYLIKNGTDSITGVVTVASPTGFLRLIDPPAIFTDATNMAYVDSRDDLKVNIAGDTMSGVLTLDNDLKMKGGPNYVTLKAHATSATYNLFLPQNAGTSGFVLSTDGNGNTTWINSANVANGTDTVTSASIVDGAIVDADINASAAIAQSKIANLSTDLAGKEPTVTNPSDISKYYRGDKSWQALNTTAVAEGSNLYFLNARVLGTDLLGLNTGVAGPITAIDTVLGAFGKLQYQVTDLKAKGQWEKNVNDIYYNIGNVGIGTTTPGSALDVKGTLRLSGSTSGYVGFAPAAVAGSTTYTLPAADGSAGQILKTNGVGVLSWVTDNSGAGAFTGALNRAVTTDGAGALSTSTTTATELGYVSGVTSSIQTQLNSKQSTTLASTNILVGNGSNVATAVAMSGDATLANTGAVTLKNTGTAGTYSSVTTDAQGRVTAGTNPVVVTSVTGTAPVTIGGTASAPVVSMAAATTAVNGYLTATDWNIFNSKQAALSTGPTINGIVYPANGAQTLQIPLAPAAATDAVNKQYVDSFGQWGTSAGHVYRTTGNVGIGTAAPTAKLDVVGNAKISGLVTIGDPTAYYNGLTINSLYGNGGTGFTIDFFSKPFLGSYTGAVALASNSGNNEVYRNAVASTKLELNSSGMQLLTAPTGTTGAAITWSEAFRVNQNGNVGIGTTTPGTTLTVQQPLNTITGGLLLVPPSGAGQNGGWYHNNDALIGREGGIDTITLNNGNVGIGITAPITKLDIRSFYSFGSSQNGALRLERYNDSTAAGWIDNIVGLGVFDNSQYDGSGFRKANSTTSSGTQYSAGNILFYTNSGLTAGALYTPGERMRIDTSGNVGIGTTAPGSALDVKGTLRLSGSTSGYVGFAPAAAAGATTYTLPTTQGTSGQVLSTNGVATTPTLSWVSVTSGTVTSVTSANADIAVATTTSTPVLTLNSGTGANQIVKLNGTSQLPAVDGSLLTSLNPANLSAAVSVAKGGTGLSAGTSGGIPYFNTATSMASSTLLGLNGIMLGGGAGAAPITLGTGVAGQFLKSAGASAPAWANLAIGDLKSTVAGNLFPGSSCGAAQTLVYSIVTDSFTCTNLPASATYWSAATGGINYASGNVGIGTTTPNSLLHLNANAPVLIMQDTSNLNSTNTFNTYISGRDSAGVESWWMGEGSSSGKRVGLVAPIAGYDINIQNSSGQIYLSTAGNVGIGTTAPGTNLEVVDTSGTTRGITSTTYSTNPGGLFQTRGARGTPAAPSALLTNDSYGWLAFSGYDGTAFSYQGQPTGINSVVTENWSSTAHGSALRFNTTPNGSIIGQERLKIDQNGNVGIGTSAPWSKLQIKGVGTSNSGFAVTSPNANQALDIMPGFALNATANGIQEDATMTIRSSGTVAGNLALATGNNEWMRLTSTGNVGIGTTSPTSTLDVNGNVGTGARITSLVDGANNAYWLAKGSSAEANRIGYGINADPVTGVVDAVAMRTNGAARLTIDNAGRVGIGTVTPGSILHLANSAPYITYEETDTTQKIFTGVDGSGYWIRQGTTANADLLTVRPTGNIGIGTSTPGYKLDVQGGNVNSAGAYTNVSDRRLKQDIRPLKNSLDKILQLEGVNYYWRDQSFDSSKQVGFIAQEVEKVFPELVKTDSRGFKAMSYSQLVSPVVSAIKELFHKWFDDSRSIHREMASIKAENTKLKQENEAIKNYLCAKDPKASICQ